MISFIKEYFYFPTFDKVGLPILAAFFIVLLIGERLSPLRLRKISYWTHLKRNIGLASVGLFVLRIVLIPVLVLLASWANKEQMGILNLLEVPFLVEFILGFLVLDYGNYLLHVFNHKIPFLWRFHNVHHVDLDMDVTTAIRFHFGEILLSVFFRGAIVLCIGAPVVLVLIYEIVFEAATNFHHSNLKLPFSAEKWLSKIIVTPRMHGIHHSVVKRETNSNFSIIFNWWDRLHRSILLNVPQAQINIGVPAYRDFKEQTVKNLLLIPFTSQRRWKFPDGSEPERKEADGKGRLVP